VGKTTAQLAGLKEGDSLQDVQGPLGKPTEIENYGRVVCIGGGVGVGVVYPVIVALKKAGNEVISIVGARKKELLILEKEIRENSDRLIITTDDGSYGIHGFVSSVFEQEILDKGEKVDRVFTIGPVPMMMAVCKITKPHRIKTIVSLNSIMVDATGMCGACRVSVAGKTKFTCVDGPEFDGHEVDFDLLSDRLKMYCDMEREAYEKHKCGCDGN
jgi:ferredoxin--NADP+ reductase